MDNSIFDSLSDIPAGSTNVEQLVSVSKDVAAIIASYYFELIKLRVPAEHAAALTTGFQNAVISNIKRPPEG